MILSTRAGRVSPPWPAIEGDDPGGEHGAGGGVAARNAVSSTPRLRTPSSRVGSSTSSRPYSRTASITVPQPTQTQPSPRAPSAQLADPPARLGAGKPQPIHRGGQAAADLAMPAGIEPTTCSSRRRPCPAAGASLAVPARQGMHRRGGAVPAAGGGPGRQDQPRRAAHRRDQGPSARRHRARRPIPRPGRRRGRLARTTPPTGAPLPSPPPTRPP
jgi:hypothetical protein